MLAGWLAEWGMSVETVETSGAAIDSIRHSAAESRPFSVALVDQRMPEMDGLALAGALVEDAALAVPIVLMTDVGKGASVGAAAKSGIHASLSKPIHSEELKLCLRIALGLAVADPVADEDALSGDPAQDGLATGRLLLAEDNAVNQKVAVAMVSSAGYRVDTVVTGIAAVQAAATGVYDAILMDCQMPELTGFEATVAIRADEGSARHTPIIAMTAGAQMQDRARCMSAGMDGYLAKPVSKEALLGLLDRFVGARKQTAVRGARVDPRAAKAATVDAVVFGKLRVLSQRAGPAFLVDLVDAFVTSTELRLVELDDAIVDGDATAVAQIAHSVKGSSSQLGGRQLAASCSELETKGTAGDLSDARAHLHKIDRDYRRLRGALTEELAVDAAATAFAAAADRTGTTR
jgi:CheY-like chemotaxis protein